MLYWEEKSLYTLVNSSYFMSPENVGKTFFLHCPCQALVILSLGKSSDGNLKSIFQLETRYYF